MLSSKIRYLRVAYREETGLKGLVFVDLVASRIAFRIADGALIPAPNGSVE